MHEGVNYHVVWNCSVFVCPYPGKQNINRKKQKVTLCYELNINQRERLMKREKDGEGEGGES